MGINAHKLVGGFEFRRMLYEMAFIPTPVFVGNPSQRICYNVDQIADFVRVNYGKRPCFISHNPVFDFAQGKYPQKTYYSKNFMDLDGDPKRGLTKEDALKDLRKLSDWFDDFALPYNIANSGHKGYHSYLRLKPEVHRIDRKLTDKIRAVQSFLASELGLRTLDFHVAEPRRITRIPTTAYVNQDGWKNNLHCIILNREIVHGMTTEQIDELAKEPFIPEEITMNPEGNYYTLDEFIIQFEVPLHYAGMPWSNGNGHGDLKEYKVTTDDHFLLIMKDIIRRPCIYRELVVEDRPAHIARVEACIEVRDLNFSLDGALTLFDDFADAADWHDKHNKIKRDTNIKSIYYHEPPYKQMTCGTLQRAGLCIGKECPSYQGK
jgi:hypothetical protein